MSRRGLSRRLADLVRAALSMFEGKHRDPNRPPRYSQFRVTVGLFAYMFARNWPKEWGGHEVAALSVIIFALPVGDLFGRVPVAEAAAALQAFFGSVAARALDRAESVRSRIYTPRTDGFEL